MFFILELAKFNNIIIIKIEEKIELFKNIFFLN